MARFATVRLLASLAVFIAADTAAQSIHPVEPARGSDLPAHVISALSSIEDFSFSFSQPGFYAVLSHIKTDVDSLDLSESATPIDAWTVLLERPAEFRGLPVTVEGTVGRNTQWQFEQPEHWALGPVWQLELTRRDQPIAVTLILTEDAGDIPLGATLRVTGYFVMMRNYYSATNRVQQAALLVGHGPTLISKPVGQVNQRSRPNHLIAIVAACTAGAFVVWLILRRSLSRGPHDLRELRASRPAPESLADDLAAWTANDPTQNDETP